MGTRALQLRLALIFTSARVAAPPGMFTRDCAGGAGGCSSAHRQGGCPSPGWCVPIQLGSFPFRTLHGVAGGPEPIVPMALPASAHRVGHAGPRRHPQPPCLHELAHLHGWPPLRAVIMCRLPFAKAWPNGPSACAAGRACLLGALAAEGTFAPSCGGSGPAPWA